MKLRKSLSLVLIATQVCLGTTLAASADTTANAAPTPEFTLVENILALQGQNLSAANAQSAANALVSAYLAKARSDGSQQRLEQALVQLGVYTTAQAQAFVTDAQTANARVLAAHPVTVEQTQSLVSSEMAQLSTMHPAGAQFSMGAATLGCAGTIAAGVGVLTVLTGLVLRYDNPTCTTQVDSGYAWVNGQYSYVQIDGPTTCTAPDYYPHAQAGDNMMIAGGVVGAVGALVMVLSGQYGCNF